MQTAHSPDTLHEPSLEPITQKYLAGALRLSRAEGWPHRLDDWALTLSVSEGVVAMLDGEVVGTAMCSIFGDVATLNMIIVDSRMRGRGLGRLLMQAVMKIADGREMRLVATEAGRPLYEKLGFEACGAIDQYQGEPKASASGEPVARVDDFDLSALTAMDFAASGLKREALIQEIASTGQIFLTEGGFAMLRAFGRGHVLGPIVARSPDAAKALIAEAASVSADKFLRVDVPRDCGLGPVLEALGLSHVGGGTAMRTQPATSHTSEFATYALVSQALG